MAFSNTRDGQSNRSNNYSKADYKPRRNDENRDYKPRTNRDNKEANSSGSRGKNYQERNSKGKDFQKRDFKSDAGKYRQNSNQGRDFKNSYRDSGKNEGFRSKSSSGADKEVKTKEQQPDKMEIINRLEREKKAMKKKTDINNRKTKPQNARPQMKVKRTNNIDWTKEYENDSYDNDDSFYDY